MNSKAPRHPRRPLIGVTPDLEEATADRPAGYFALSLSYADAVSRAGGLPFIFPYSEDLSCVHSYLDRVSGLLVTGGTPAQAPAVEGDGARNRFETALLRGALARNIPVLGISAGMQLMNVVMGGTLVQDIATELKEAKSHRQSHDLRQPHHPIEVHKGTTLALAVGAGALMVNSMHRRAIRRPGEKIVVSAVSPDGLTEAIEIAGQGFALGVQWNPELLIDSVPANFGVYKTFVQRAREHHGSRRH